MGAWRKRQSEREADTTNVEVKNRWNFTSALYISLYNVIFKHRDDLNRVYVL